MGHPCLRCNSIFKYKGQLKRHMDRKYPCKEANGGQEHRCTWCLKLFKDATNLKEHVCKWKDDEIRCLEIDLGMEIEPIYDSKKCRYCKSVYAENKKCVFHMKTCKKKETYVEELKKKQSQMEQEDKSDVVEITMKKTEPVVLKKADTVNAQGVQIGGTQNTQINITLNAFGKENIDYIDKKQVMKLVERFLTYNRNIEGFCAALSKLMHGNKYHPENHSVLMLGEKKATAMVYNGKSFEERKAVDVTQSIIENGADHVCAVYDDNKSEMMNVMSQSKIEMVEDLANDASRKKMGRCRAAVKQALCLKDVRDDVKATMKAKR